MWILGKESAIVIPVARAHRATYVITLEAENKQKVSLVMHMAW